MVNNNLFFKDRTMELPSNENFRQITMMVVNEFIIKPAVLKGLFS